MESRLLERLGAISRKALAFPLSLILAAGCAPSPAYAASVAPASGAVGASAFSVQAQGAATSSLYSLYLPVLFRAANGMGEFSGSYSATESSQWVPEYYLFDLGNDGVPELFVRTNAFGDNYLVHVYTAKSGKLVNLGSYWEWVGKTATNTKGELFVVGWTQGKSYVSSVSIVDNQVVCHFLKAGKATASNPGGEIQMVNDFLSDKGASWVSASGIGDYATLSSQARYVIARAAVTVGSGGTYDGTARTPKVTVKFAGKTLVAGTDYKVAYQNNVNAGTATVVITGLGDYRGTKKSAFVIARQGLGKAAVTVASGGIYTGSAKKPAVTVKLGAKTLKSGTDYTLAYKNNVNAGTATVVVTGKGNYQSSRSATFGIAKASVASAAVTVDSGGVYTGLAKNPAVAVKLGTKTLKPGADYTLAYKNNVNAGTATVVVTGKGSYQGSRNASFVITKIDNPMAVKAASKTLKLSALAKAKETFSPVSFSKKAQGKVSYKSVSSAAVSKHFSVNASTGVVTAKKGTAKGTYAVKIQVTAEGNGNYKASSKTVAFTVTVK